MRGVFNMRWSWYLFHFERFEGLFKNSIRIWTLHIWVLLNIVWNVLTGSSFQNNLLITWTTSCCQNWFHIKFNSNFRNLQSSLSLWGQYSALSSKKTYRCMCLYEKSNIVHFQFKFVFKFIHDWIFIAESQFLYMNSIDS